MNDADRIACRKCLERSIVEKITLALVPGFG
jgi:hypothetical protein